VARRRGGSANEIYRALVGGGDEPRPTP